MSMLAASDPPADAVGPLERGLTVIRALTEAADWAPTASTPVPTAQLVRATGLARSTVDRVVATLAACGLVRTTGRDVALAPGLAALGNAYLASCRLPAVLDRYVRDLADRFDESVSVAVPDGVGVRFVTQLARRRTMAPAFRIGDLLPAERCAPGALFAAEWDRATWQTWQKRRADDPGDRAFPALRSPALHPPALHPPALRSRELRPQELPGPDLPTPDLPTPSRSHRSDDDPTAAAAATVTAPDGDPAQTFAHRVELARRDGYAVDDQRVETGLVAVAVPIAQLREPGPRPRRQVAVSVVSHTSRHSARSLARDVLDALRDVADEAAAALAADDQDTGLGLSLPAPPLVTADVAATAEAGSSYLQSLARGLAVFTAFGAGRQAPTLSELATATGLPRATARRSLITLEHLGYVTSAGGRFALLPRALELGFAPLTRLGVAELAQPHLRSLSDSVGESASMAALAGDEILYVARVPTRRIMTVDISVGTRLPAYPTSMGRVLLAGLPQAERDAYLARTRPAALTRRTETDPSRLRKVLAAVARDDYALVSEELEDGVQSIAVPVRDGSGRTVAAVNVSMYAGRATPAAARQTLLGPLRATAAAISADVQVLSAFRPTPLL